MTHPVSQMMSQNLAAKAAAMNNYTQRDSYWRSISDTAYAANTPSDIRVALRMAIENSYKNAYRQMRSATAASMIPVDQQISALESVSLANKRQILDAMPIIPVPVGAAFLGIPAADLHAVNSQGDGVFGGFYMRRRCNSINELLLIAQNPEWLPSSPALVASDSSALDSITYVDHSTAAAYINMECAELVKRVQAKGHVQRYPLAYRVSDLEVIRVAKLKFQQA